MIWRHQFTLPGGTSGLLPMYSETSLCYRNDPRPEWPCSLLSPPAAAAGGVEVEGGAGVNGQANRSGEVKAGAVGKNEELFTAGSGLASGVTGRRDAAVFGEEG